MTDLRSKTLKLASTLPRSSDLRQRLVVALWETREAMLFETERDLEKYLEEHPDADPSNHRVDPQGLREQKGEEERGLSGAIRSIKEKADQRLEKVSDKVESFKAGMAEGGSLGQAAEVAFALVMAVLFPQEGGKEVLDNVLEKLQTKDEKKTQQAISALKAAELATVADPEIAEFMKKELGFDPEFEKDDVNLIRDYFSNEMDDLSASEREVLADFISELDEGRIAFLQQFVDDGEMDLEGLMAHLDRGMRRKDQKRDEKSEE